MRPIIAPKKYYSVLQYDFLVNVYAVCKYRLFILLFIVVC